MVVRCSAVLPLAAAALMVSHLDHASAFCVGGGPSVRPLQVRSFTLGGSPLPARMDSKSCLAMPLRAERRSSGNLRAALSGSERISKEGEGGTTAVKATDYFKPLVAGDILESTSGQRAIVGGAYIFLFALAAKGFLGLEADVPHALGAMAAILVGYEFADFGSGVYHWAMDNYGNKNTPIFGTQIEAFQGHHELPWTITYRQVCNNIYKICQATTPFCLAALFLIDNPFVLIWMTTALIFINMSQELHKWSHSSPAECHPIINALQGANIIISRKAHLAHHRPPFDGNYCIVSGHCNPYLDQKGFFRWLEEVVYSINGAEARCWSNERLLGDKIEELGLKKGTSNIVRGTKTQNRSEGDE